ncbi:TPA: HK97 family phage prohead protease [Candidatus Poribacteria bacterium]|nr:HK97 family phage prohead protease [Candidatus Poribacteria bacterium]
MKIREQRNFISKKLTFEIRQDQGEKIFEGFIPYNVRSEFMGFYEILKPGCFRKTIQEQRIVALWNHDTNLVLGNTSSGNFALQDSEDGLRCRLVLPRTNFADDCYEIVRAGIVNTMSFGFSVIREQWDENAQERQILEARLYEISFGVPFPAYTETLANTRELIMHTYNLDIEKLAGLLSRERLTKEDQKEIQVWIDKLNALIHTDQDPAPVMPRSAPITEMDLELFKLKYMEE